MLEVGLEFLSSIKYNVQNQGLCSYTCIYLRVNPNEGLPAHTLQV